MTEETQPATPPLDEVATSGDGRDITRAFTSALLDVQDTVLRRLGSNYEVYRELRRDGQVASCKQQRRLALKSRPLVIEPGAKDAKSIAAAEHLKDNLAQIPFDRSSGLMLWGVFYGYSVGECMFEVRDGRVWFKPFKVRTAWRFRFDREGKLRLLTRANQTTGELMPPAKFWTTSWGADNDDDPTGLGLAHQLYWPVFFKKQGLGFWLRALEKFGAPSVHGTYPAGSTKEIQDQLLAAASRMRIDGAVVTPEGTTLKLIEAMRGTVDQATFKSMMDAEISKIILGQTMTTDDGASRSQGQVHMEVREELVDADADELCESFMAGPATWLTQWNFPGAATPIVRRPAPEDEKRSADLISAKAGAVESMKAAGYEPTPETEQALFGDGWVKVKTPEPPKVEGKPELRLVGGADFAEGPAPDAIEMFAEEMDWRPQAEEPIAFLEEFFGSCDTLEEARDRLPALLAQMPIGKLKDGVARACFEARLAGQADLSISAEETAARAEG